MFSYENQAYCLLCVFPWSLTACATVQHPVVPVAVGVLQEVGCARERGAGGTTLGHRDPFPD